MSKIYDYVIFIGRFQPFHAGHKLVVDTALSIADKVIICMGSSFSPRTPKNPFTVTERESMLYDTFPDQVANIRVAFIRDQLYNDQMWAASIQEEVDRIVHSNGWTDKPPRVAIIGHSKDDSSYYLKMFPQWTLIEHEMDDMVNATDIRELYFEGKNLKFLQTILSAPVFRRLEVFKMTQEYKTLVKEHTIIKQYKKRWEVAPFPPTFVTVDAVVVQSGHVLMVTRDAAPGEGLKALPGGFLEQGETLIDGVIRELREETGVKVPGPVLKGSIKASHVFDAPKRSLRGRTITHAFLIELPPGTLPPVKGGDDARDAFWVPVSEIHSDECFDDHYDIIHYFL